MGNQATGRPHSPEGMGQAAGPAGSVLGLPEPSIPTAGGRPGPSSGVLTCGASTCSMSQRPDWGPPTREFKDPGCGRVGPAPAACTRRDWLSRPVGGAFGAELGGVPIDPTASRACCRRGPGGGRGRPATATLGLASLVTPASCARRVVPAKELTGGPTCVFSATPTLLRSWTGGLKAPQG